MVDFKEVLRRQNVRDALLAFNGNTFNWRSGIPLSKVFKIRDAIPVNALIESRLAGVMNRKTSIEQNGADEKVLETVKFAMSNINVKEAAVGAFDAILFGFAMSAVSWGIEGGIYVPQNLEFLNIDGWQWRPSQAPAADGLPALEYGYGKNKVVIDKENKFVFIPVFRKRSAYKPLGRGVLNNDDMFWRVQYLQAGLEFWVEFTEKYGSPFLVAKTRQNADATELNLIDRMLAAAKKAFHIRVPQGTDLQFLEAATKGASADVYEKLLKYIREDITLEVLGHTGAAISTAGKLGNENSALVVREDIADLDCGVVASFFNQLIERIVNLNFGVKTYPKFIFLPKEDYQKELSNRDKKIYDMGIDIAPQYFAQNYGIPIEFLTKKETFLPMALANSGEKKGEKAEFLQADVAHQSADVDYFGFDSIVEQVKKIIENCESYESAKKEIINKFGEIDDSFLAQVLENAMIFSELKGRIK